MAVKEQFKDNMSEVSHTNKTSNILLNKDKITRNPKNSTNYLAFIAQPAIEKIER